MNVCSFIGRICNEVKLEKANETSVVGINFALKTDRKNQDGSYRTAFLNCKAFGTTAEKIAQYFKKGDPIAITAKVTDESYTTQDGKNVSKIGFIIFGFDFLKPKEKTQTQAQSQQSDNDDDIPF